MPTMLKPEVRRDEFPIARAITSEIWAAMGGDEAAPQRVTFAGEGDLRSPFPVVDFAAATFAVAGLGVTNLLEKAGVSPGPINVDRRHATIWFDVPLAPTRFIDTPERHGVHAKWMVEFQTADDRWMRVQASYPTLRRRLLAALGVSEGLDSIAAALRVLPAEEAERRLIEAGAAVAIARSLAEWEAHPQGAAVAQEPIAAVRETLVAKDQWKPVAERPLHGVRVLDMTRVVAAPMATRLLAALGAEVLRIDPPGADEVALGGANDIMLGKRWALLDARTEEGRARYKELLSTADIFIHSYRAGAIDSLGFDENERAAIRPGLVEVVLNAYGWTGPWRGRRGFDTLVQYASGIADEVSRWANEAPERRLPLNALGHLVDASRPRHLPVEALDFGTGYLLAAAALRGLARRLETGRGSITKMSLARTAALLTSAVRPAGGVEFTLPHDMPFADERVWDLGGRPSRRLAFPLQVDGVPLFWDRPAELPGSSSPSWSTRPPRWAAFEAG
ncbi:CoA transferase [Bradyrhizobium elkanii]|uniref:CoA transferase n=1 Tax=Bradyrhizobium elkanii TaxID=29448 RepID=UPI0003F81042|nr:CoA transferase [Bradyrhizobium elkanii]